MRGPRASADATLQDYLDAGLYRIMQPRRFGRYDFDLETFLRVTVELSRGCPSSGWVFRLMATHNLIAGLFEERAQVELFEDGDFRCPLSAVPAPALSLIFNLCGRQCYSRVCPG